MAYLNKHQYDYRRESAARRNLDNEKIAVENGMTQEQAEFISNLCSNYLSEIDKKYHTSFAPTGSLRK